MISAADYDALMKFYFDELDTPALWPDIRQIDMFEKDPDRWVLFCCYLYEKGSPPRTGKDRYSKKNLQHFIGEHLEIVDDDAGTDERVKQFLKEIPDQIREQGMKEFMDDNHLSLDEIVRMAGNNDGQEGETGLCQGKGTEKG